VTLPTCESGCSEPTELNSQENDELFLLKRAAKILQLFFSARKI
jgi:hypothetical protein